ncbi:MAG: hypothetical protein AAF481_19910 [Acidobacteriota bacterium]
MTKSKVARAVCGLIPWMVFSGPLLAGVPPQDLEEGTFGPKAMCGLSASVAVKDPATGEFIETLSTAASPSVEEDDFRALPAPPAALVEEPVAARAGGIRVRLRGWSQHSVWAHRKGDGRLEVDCSVPSEEAHGAEGGPQ